MPHKYSVKTYVKNGYYHIYNRGVEKRDIFLDEQDYTVFLHLLKYYLSPLQKDTPHPLINLPNYPFVRPRPLTNIAGEVDLLAYCLMPNHFHLLIKQYTSDGMTKLLRRTATTFSMYFNKRYKRVGYLFQGRYKAALIENDSYLLHLSRYIHLNPTELTGTHLVNYPYSSYAFYLGKKKADWIKPEFILSFFKTAKGLPFLKNLHNHNYEDFVETYLVDSRTVLGNLLIED